jgi:N-acyl-D-aspartate/D-glutamate deacylase
VAFQKAERAFLAARARHETAEAELRGRQEALETSRRNVLEATEAMQDKMREVELLRVQKSVDDRERAVRITELKGKSLVLFKS